MLRFRAIRLLLVVIGPGLLPASARAVVAFDKVALPTTQGAQYTSLAFGPDGKLYATVLNGEIRRWPLNPDGTTGPAEIITSLRTAEGGDRLSIGLVFDPASTPWQPVAWVTHSTYGLSGMADWGGRISRLSGPNLETVQLMVTNLPRSSGDHVTNGIAFGPDGMLYFLQGSNTQTGAPHSSMGNRPERLLTAAVLRLDPSLITTPPLDVKTQDGGTYDPFALAAPLKLHATGFRNAYDLVWHTNGQLYVPTNGVSGGYPTPAGVVGAPCAGGGTNPGPAVPALGTVATQNDFLFRVVAGGYYGHPNPLLCNFVLNGGNPTAGTDPAEVTEYPVGTQPDPDYRGFAYDFGPHPSADGIIEYRHAWFGAELQGKLLVTRYASGGDIIVLTPGGPNLDIVSAQTGLTGLTGFDQPLDLIENRTTGCVYVSEFGSSRITLLRPPGALSVGGIRLDGVSFAIVSSPARHPALSFTLPEAADMELAVFDPGGRRVMTLIHGRVAAGTRTHAWDGRDPRGQAARAGVYFFRLKVGAGEWIVRGVKLD